jgi:Fe-S-cluster containining protein
MLGQRPEPIKNLERAVASLFQMYGGCDNCDHCLCCKIFSPVVYAEEIDFLAGFLGITPYEFEKKYLLKVYEKDPNFISYVINTVPCPFLQRDRCSIHIVRPFACSSFPIEIGMECVQLHGMNICPTATLIAEEIRDFIEKPNQSFKTVWKVRAPSGTKVDAPIFDPNMNDDYLNCINKVYKKIGVLELNQQDESEVYEINKFVWFLESKGLMYIDESDPYNKDWE